MRSRWRAISISSSAAGTRRPSRHHVDEPAKRLRAQRVERIVALEHRLRQTEVARDEGVQRLLEHRLGDVEHPRQQLLLRQRPVAR